MLLTRPLFYFAPEIKILTLGYYIIKNTNQYAWIYNDRIDAVKQHADCSVIQAKY